MATTLPEQPNLDQLRNQALELQRAVRAGDPDALALAGLRAADAAFPLSRAHLALARRHGFASWVRLRRHVEAITARSWRLPLPAADESPADRFVRQACVNYEDDDVRHPVPSPDPELAATNLAVAAAGADAGAVRTLLASGADAQQPTGGYGWSPLMYATYSRVPVGVDDSLATVALLLDAGADPNDGQALYNRMFEPADDSVELLLEFGDGTGGGGPWRRLLPDGLPAPTILVRGLLGWAVTHDQRDRVALLARHGVDIASPIDDGPGNAAGQRPHPDRARPAQRTSRAGRAAARAGRPRAHARPGRRVRGGGTGR